MSTYTTHKVHSLSCQDRQRYFTPPRQDSTNAVRIALYVLASFVACPSMLILVILAVISPFVFLAVSSACAGLVIGLVKLLERLKRQQKNSFSAPFVVPPPPTDEEYEAWVKSWANAIQQYGVKKLGLDPSDILGQSLYVRSIVWPRSHGAKYYSNYNCPVLIKQGIDKRPHGNINRFTFFYPTQHYIAVFAGDINALHTLRFEETRMYYYKDIVGIETSGMALDDGITTYPMQHFELRVSSGQSISATTYVEDLDVEQTIRALRTLLRDKKYTI